MVHFPQALQAVLIEEQSMTLDQLALACDVQVDWLAERIEARLLGPDVDETARFGSRELARARRLAQCEQLFDVNAEAAAFMVDLIEEVAQLRAKVAHGVPDWPAPADDVVHLILETRT